MCLRCPDTPLFEPTPDRRSSGPGSYGRQPNYGEGDFGPMPKGRGLFGLLLEWDVQWVQGRRRDRGRAIGGIWGPPRRMPHNHPQ